MSFYRLKKTVLWPVYFVLRHESRVTLAGFPSKYSEAVAYGTPVIINALPSVRACHIDGKTGFSLDPDDRDGASDALCDILAMEPENVKAMKRFCRAYGAFTAPTFEAPMLAFMATAGRSEALAGTSCVSAIPAAPTYGRSS